METGKRKRGKRARDAAKRKKNKIKTLAPPQQQPQKSSSTPNSSKRRKTSDGVGGGGDTSFLDKMKARLAGGHFRMINEKLYTSSGSEAFEYFQEDPSLFNVYHTGYQEQMSHWPEKPVDVIIKWLKEHNTSLIVADLGCGDARIAKHVKNKVFSFDLVAKDSSVIECDMSNIPLVSCSIDVAVFCLSLMGTTFPTYLTEAHRVLKPSGWLLIAEVKSRFDPNSGGADPNSFLKAVCDLGFKSVSIDFSNKMFLLFFFKKKEKTSEKEIEWPELKPCLYKRR